MIFSNTRNAAPIPNHKSINNNIFIGGGHHRWLDDKYIALCGLSLLFVRINCLSIPSVLFERLYSSKKKRHDTKLLFRLQSYIYRNESTTQEAKTKDRHESIASNIFLLAASFLPRTSTPNTPHFDTPCDVADTFEYYS